MLISVVTPAYNAERWLAATMDSVIGQSHSDWQYIVVDDGSGDGTAALADGYAQSETRIVVHRQANAGVAAARNAGLRLISPDAEAVIFLDADDTWRPDTLALLARALQANAAAPAVHGRAESIDAEGRGIPLLGYESEGRRFVKTRSASSLSAREVAVLPDTEPTSFAALALFNPISTPGQVLIRRTALDRVGLFDSGAKPAEDWDLWLRLSMFAPFGYLPQTVIDYRRHTANASSQHSKMRQADLYVRRKTVYSTTRLNREANRTARLSLRHVELERCVSRLRLAREDLARWEFSAALRELARASRSLLLCADSVR